MFTFSISSLLTLMPFSYIFLSSIELISNPDFVLVLEIKFTTVSVVSSGFQNSHIDLIYQLLKFRFPESHSISVATSAIGDNHKFRGVFV